MKKETCSGEELFEQYYSELFGERWEKIKNAFHKEPDYCAIGCSESEEKYYIDAASVLCAGCLPVVGAENILFGTDCPWGGARKHIRFVEDFCPDESMRELIFHRNAERLLGVTVPEI